MNPQHQKFVDCYLVHLNQARAAEEAGYAHPPVAGARLMQREDVKEAIVKAMEVRGKRVAVTQDAVVKELAKIAFGDPRKVMSWGPDGVKLVPSEELSDDAAACVAEVAETISESEKGSSRNIKVKLNDKVAALTLLGRHLGMFTDKLEVSGNVELGSRLEAVRRRLKEVK